METARHHICIYHEIVCGLGQELNLHLPLHCKPEFSIRKTYTRLPLFVLGWEWGCVIVVSKWWFEFCGGTHPLFLKHHFPFQGTCPPFPRLLVPKITSQNRDQKRGHYERGLFAGGISRISKTSQFSRISRKWSDSLLFPHSGGSLESLIL